LPVFAQRLPEALHETGCSPRLGVFAGTFGLPAAEAVGAAPAGPGQAAPVIDTLSALVDSSLVRAQARDGEPRFGLLETIREYALERLRDSGDWEAAHDQHSAYFGGLAQPAETELQGPGQLAWLGRLETEHGNLSAALSWLVESRQLEQALHMLWATWRFWWLRGTPRSWSPTRKGSWTAAEACRPMSVPWR
jgi:predicted ATPase